MVFVGYYTVGTPYALEAAVLRESLDALGYPHHLIAVDPRGSWQKNTQMKAEVVAGFLEKYDGRRICYIDVDSIVLGNPVLARTVDADIAAVRFAGDGKGCAGELLSGVVMFRANDATRALVQRWREINAEFPDKLPDGRPAWDQRTLDLAIRRTGTSFAELPPAYNYIVGLSQKTYPGVAPIILATRGALKHQNVVNVSEAVVVARRVEACQATVTSKSAEAA